MIATMQMQGNNHHCSVIAIDGIGILIEGPAGSGKTSLALGLVDAARRRGAQADLIADDQCMLEATEAGLSARVPETIAGLAEVRGHGIVRVNHVPACIVGLVVRLRDDGEIARMPEDDRISILGIALPAVDVPVRHEAQSIRIILARLGIPLV